MRNQNIIDNINVELLPEETFDLQNLINDAKGYIDEVNLLKESTNYSDNYWSMYSYLRAGNLYLDFNPLEKFKFIGVTPEQIDLIKCWIIDNIINNSLNLDNNETNKSGAQARLMHLIKFIEETSNFDEEYLESDDGYRFNYYYDSMSLCDSTKKDYIASVVSYIEFIEDKVKNEELKVYLKYLVKLNEKQSHLKNEYNSRVLPNAKNISLFANYLNIFFNDSNIPECVKQYFKPILLWWKLTTVIPMRPSEFCVKLKRNALIKENNNTFFLKIGRIKKHADAKYNLLPVMDRVKITKELYDLFYNYIEDTNEYGESETLISYSACKYFRAMIQKETNLYTCAHTGLKQKKDATKFTTSIFSRMLADFYKTIIVKTYNDKAITEKILPGDTRHIAFTSLMLQGYSPVEIAILGGHRSLATLDNYTHSVNTYINSEVLTLVRKNIKVDSKEYNTLIARVYSMPDKCPVPLENTFETEIDDITVGRCTAKEKFKITEGVCEDDYCYKCNNWWCEPSEYSFLKLEKIVKSKLKDKTSKLHRDLDFIKSLMVDVGFELDGDKLIIDNTVAQQIRRISLELHSNTKSIIHLAYEMIDPTDETLTLLTRLEDILPTEEVNKYIDEKVQLYVKEDSKIKE